MVIETLDLQAGYRSGKFLKNTGPKANFKAQKGDLIAFMGKNGVGKSTFLKTLAQLQKALGGEIKIQEKNTYDFTRKDLAKTLAFVSTETAANNFLSVFETIALGRYPYTNWFGSLDEEDYEIVEKAIRLVKLDELKSRYVNEISDGEKQRTMIARAIAQETSIILLDEPTAFLDLQNKYLVSHILSDLAHKEQKTIIFSTHDLSIALDVADKIWFFSEEKAIEAAPEEFLLNGYFEDFLGNELHFDENNYTLKRVHSFYKEINLESSSSRLQLLAAKALERIGFRHISSATTTIKADVNFFHYIKGSEKKEFNNLYELCRFLSNLRE